MLPLVGCARGRDDVNGDGQGATGRATSRRLSKADRRRQLLDTALLIVHEEGADRLTLGHLAARAGVSKPVAYDHFGTRSGLLIELYRWIDLERVNAFRDSMATGERSREESVRILAAAYIDCAADTNGEFHAVGAALAGSEEKALVFQQLLDNSVQMFVSVLTPHCTLPLAELQRRCVGLVRAGEVLSGALVRGQCTESEAAEALASLITGAVPGA